MRICGSFFAAIGKNKSEIDLRIGCIFADKMVYYR